jgi:acyl-CoA thioesterase FadM
MARIKIKPEEHYHFETMLVVRIDDINYGNHLSNDKYLSLAFEARFRFYRHFGVDEMNLGGASTIMTYANVNYLAESKYGDQLLVKIALRELSNSGFELLYQFLDQQTGRAVALIETGIVCFDYLAKKVMPVPDTFKAHFV